MVDRKRTQIHRYVTKGRRVHHIICAATVSLLVATSPALSLEQNATGPQQSASSSCPDIGQWLEPSSGEVLENKVVLERAAESQVVLLGETHTSREDHLWQTHTLAGLHALHPDLVVGFEAFPRRTQVKLDLWSRGDLSKASFLAQTGWDQVWGYDADLYMPLFDFVRQNRVPMIALNVDRQLVSRVGRNGWSAVPSDAREGMSDPAPASLAYREALAGVYEATAAHRRPAGNGDAKQGGGADAETTLPVLEQPGFARFVEAQLTWDRAMAEALADAVKNRPGTLVIGVIGRGHLEHGHGVPHQLTDLGIERVTTLIPVDANRACAFLEPSLADAAFVVEGGATAEAASGKPRLGVFIEPASEGGLLLSRVIEGSIAEAAQLSAGDIVLNAAGAPVKTPRDLVDIVDRQAPGTWLPLDIRRGGEELTLVAKFPSELDPSR